MMTNTFYAKILLFGEYGVIWDSMALTVPYTHFSGRLDFAGRKQMEEDELIRESNRHIARFVAYLAELQQQAGFGFRFNLGQIGKDLAEGLYFASGIPQGYGVGSSGALVAALYDRYGLDKPGREDLSSEKISWLKKNFSGMESHFHGTSSGLDPLNCYLGTPLLIRSKTRIEPVAIPRDLLGPGSAICLADTGTLGNTGPLVKLFLERCRDDSYRKKVLDVFIPAGNACILSLLESRAEDFFHNLGLLSAFQFEYLAEMIPESMRPLWKAGLNRDDFKMKLCGSGGGGYLLVITRDYPATKAFFHNFKLDLTPVYQNIDP